VDDLFFLSIALTLFWALLLLLELCCVCGLELLEYMLFILLEIEVEMLLILLLTIKLWWLLFLLLFERDEEEEELIEEVCCCFCTFTI
jgi:D-alanyl-lipoteichoic acid acyltransferase DltB (MBOAT superfamily)